MKIFKVITERDGIQHNSPGIITTEVMREEYFYVAKNMQDVWDGIEWIRNDEEKTLMCIQEWVGSATVISNGTP